MCVLHRPGSVSQCVCYTGLGQSVNVCVTQAWVSQSMCVLHRPGSVSQCVCYTGLGQSVNVCVTQAWVSQSMCVLHRPGSVSQCVCYICLGQSVNVCVTQAWVSQCVCYICLGQSVNVCVTQAWVSQSMCVLHRPGSVNQCVCYQVTCGVTSAVRGRRDTSSVTRRVMRAAVDRARRSGSSPSVSHVYLVTFHLHLPYHEQDSSPQHTYQVRLRLATYLGLSPHEEYRPSTTICQCIRLWAVFSSSFQEWSLLSTSASVSLRHAFLGHLLFLFPSPSSPVGSNAKQTSDEFLLQYCGSTVSPNIYKLTYPSTSLPDETFHNTSCRWTMFNPSDLARNAEGEEEEEWWIPEIWRGTQKKNVEPQRCNWECRRRMLNPSDVTGNAEEECWTPAM